jgi:D-alanyl-D-alanine-carboxypeptidase/D-alanyl-D-alanine-endopeptidase
MARIGRYDLNPLTLELLTMKIVRSLALIAFVILTTTAARAQHFPSDEDLTTLIQSRVDEGRAVGIVLGIIEADGSTRIVSYGDAGPTARPLSAQSVFEIGSITKVFTGILLADMAARGEVSLTDPVAKYLPEGVTMPSRGDQEITLLDLSTHHSALPRLPDNLSLSDAANPYADYTDAQMYEFLSGYELSRDIGAEYEYSNLAVGLLGQVLARVSGGSYESLVRERILDPLGMKRTGIALNEDMKSWMANGHDPEGNVVPLWDLPTFAGAGALRSDVTDMLVFLAANTGPAETSLERSMRDSHEVQKRMNKRMGVALNWHVQYVADEEILWHNGGTAGFRTFIGFDPAKNVGVVVLTNSAHGADDIGFHLVNPGMPLAEAPVERVEVKVSREILDTYVGEYELAREFIIVVTRKGRKLFAQATGQEKFQVFAESETKFFYKVVDAQISFVDDDSGEIASLILHQNGAEQPAKKRK